MPEEWLIDGYNVLHSGKVAGHIGSSDPLAWLLGRAAEFASSAKHLVLLVLDGFGSEEQQFSKNKFFRVLYSKKKSADTYIESYLFKNRSRARMTVVTNDRAVSDIARGGGARVLSAAAFMELLEETKRQNTDILFHEKVRSHGFNRPFDKKLRDKGFVE